MCIRRGSVKVSGDPAGGNVGREETPPDASLRSRDVEHPLPTSTTSDAAVGQRRKMAFAQRSRPTSPSAAVAKRWRWMDSRQRPRENNRERQNRSKDLPISACGTRCRMQQQLSLQHVCAHMEMHAFGELCASARARPIASTNGGLPTQGVSSTLAARCAPGRDAAEARTRRRNTVLERRPADLGDVAGPHRAHMMGTRHNVHKRRDRGECATATYLP